jgi:hypothetical protein|tara:strand:- start:221 stop:511 length:291 start_codon:yes stop_codon:yes gene_type:complete
MTDESVIDFETFLLFFTGNGDRMEFAYNVTKYFEDKGINDRESFAKFVGRTMMQEEITEKLMEWLKEADPELANKLEEMFPAPVPKREGNVVQFPH